MCADIDECILFRRNDWNKLANFPDLLRFFLALNKNRWDIILDVQGLFRSGISTFFARNSGNAFGFSDARECAPWFYNTSVSVPASIPHAVDRNIYLLNEALGWEEPYVAPTFKTHPGAVAEIDGIIEDFPSLVAVCVGSRWPSKNWPPEFFSEVIEKLLATAVDTRIVLVGSPDDEPIGDCIMEHVSNTRLINTIGRTSLPGLVEILRRSQLLLTNDSGPMHIAAALEIPTVALFGPTSPARCGPYGDSHRVFFSNAECRACYNRECPLPHQVCYSDTFDASDVTNAALELLSDN